MIKVEDVFFTYPYGVEALRGVSTEIDDGEFVAIMGENGAGKTTLVKHFNGVLKPTKGEVFVNGNSTKKFSIAELSREVGLVFQNPSHQLFCETVEDEIAFGLKNFGFSKEAVSKRGTWALNFLNLVEHKKSSPFILSGGERKRVALASVLAWDPKVIVIDEPTLGQDYRQKEMLRHFVTHLNAQGKTVILVTHDVEFVAECSPRVVLMSRGQIVADGLAKKVLTDPEVVTKASVVSPQITQLFFQLADLGLPKDVMDVYEAHKLLTGLLKKRVDT